jgi:hypothetical protein
MSSVGQVTFVILFDRLKRAVRRTFSLRLDVPQIGHDGVTEIIEYQI